VTAEGNTKERAEKLIKPRFPRFHLVVLSGSNHIRVCLSGTAEWLDSKGSGKQSQAVPSTLIQWMKDHVGMDLQTKPSVSDVLTAIVKDKGLGNPIAVIGCELRFDSVWRNMSPAEIDRKS
jgi:hypothetical protein